MKPGLHFRQLRCQRHGHEYVFFFKIDLKFSEALKASDPLGHGLQYELIKIGQRPSIQDVAGADLRRFASVLDQEDYRELNKATGLFSHAIGVGSFVYLRRIFERLISQRRSVFEAASGPIEKWPSLRMDEKIELLRPYLPNALVENKSAYGILSKGIHELTEDQCLLYFPAVRAAIVAILQQALEEKNRANEAETLRKEIARISSELGKSGVK
jgi:hypothetical protein